MSVPVTIEPAKASPKQVPALNELEQLLHDARQRGAVGCLHLAQSTLTGQGIDELQSGRAVFGCISIENSIEMTIKHLIIDTVQKENYRGKALRVCGRRALELKNDFRIWVTEKNGNPKEERQRDSENFEHGATIAPRLTSGQSPAKVACEHVGPSHD